MIKGLEYYIFCLDGYQNTFEGWRKHVKVIFKVWVLKKIEDLV